MLALFLYLENKIIRSIGNPKMADNRKMVATCQGSTCRKILTSGVEENAYGNWAFSPEHKETYPLPRLYGMVWMFPSTRNISLGQKNTPPEYSAYGKATNC